MPIITYDTIAERVHAMLGVPVETLTPETALRTIVNDSYQLVEIIVDVQEEYDVIFTHEDLAKVETLADLVSLLQEKDVSLPDESGHETLPPVAS